MLLILSDLNCVVVTIEHKQTSEHYVSTSCVCVKWVKRIANVIRCQIDGRKNVKRLESSFIYIVCVCVCVRKFDGRTMADCEWDAMMNDNIDLTIWPLLLFSGIPTRLQLLLLLHDIVSLAHGPLTMKWWRVLDGTRRNSTQNKSIDLIHPPSHSDNRMKILSIFPSTTSCLSCLTCYLFRFCINHGTYSRHQLLASGRTTLYVGRHWLQTSNIYPIIVCWHFDLHVSIDRTEDDDDDNDESSI